ncbi:MAG: nucleotide exchange factor GrpE [Ignavibacteriae bacterium HGW-Ignavibacteriae-2]|jgi:molecular chaperone GrpE|nr:nucleotide exchange factor GrpE [Bacteroidota bacterium]PKL90158.1 MAG: nucleotide exchange factor GrpE [Ignavibacteriae bacterium HGW-Ignavibacteriae-2]
MKKKEHEIKETPIENSEEIQNEIDNEAGEQNKIEIESEYLTRIQDLEEKNKELNDRLLRRAAEFENYKRRTEQDQLNLLKYAAEPFIIKTLSIYDDLQRSLNHINDENNNQSLKDGLKLVLDKFTKTLMDLGVEKIKSKGEQFDFNFHEALMQRVTPEYPSNTIIEEVEAGYMYKDKVIKHSKVIVSHAPDEEEKNSDDNNEAMEN